MKASPIRAYIGIGGNLGAVAKTFSGALSALRAVDGVDVLRVSPLYTSEPVGGPPGQPPFLNAVIEIETRLGAHRVLEQLFAIEARFARQRAVRWGPRTLDLDVLLYGPQCVINDPPELIVPHPRLTERAFVLAPLAALAPSIRVPGTGQTVAALYDKLAAQLRAEVVPGESILELKPLVFES